jgi:hypothetical protein
LIRPGEAPCCLLTPRHCTRPRRPRCARRCR